MGFFGRYRRSRGETAAVPGDRWLVVGLGNPEHEYGGTRHNVGADTVRGLAEQLGVSLRAHKSGTEVADTWTHPGGVPITLAIPFGYMNESGGPVQRAMKFYSVPPEQLVVIHDEIDLELGKLRLKLGGGNAGHNGLKDVQRRIGTPDFYRVRIGVGRPPGRQAASGHVLKRFGARERQVVDVTIAEAAEAVLTLVRDGLEAAQNRYH